MLRRIVLVLAVAALMVAMLAANAMPALAKADVQPKNCDGDPTYSWKFCSHSVATPSGNFNEHHTAEEDSPFRDFRQHTNTHSKPV